MDYPIRYKNESNNNNEPPHLWKAVTVIALVFIASIIIFHILCSCNTVKHDQKKLDKIENRHPALMSSELNKLFPPLIGADTTYDKPDSSDYFNQAADSVQHQDTFIIRKTDTVNNIIDTCVTFAEDADDYNRGYNKGYNVGVLRGKGMCPKSTVTIKDSIPSTILVQINALQKDTSINHDTIITWQTKYNGVKNYQYWFWGIIALIVGISIFKFVAWAKGKLPIKMG